MHGVKINFDELVGKRYNRLVILGESKIKVSNRIAICQCDCGTIKQIELNCVLRGTTKSCGCYKAETTIARNTTHGHTADSRSPMYAAWVNMHSACYTPSNPGYHNQGAKGITICTSWHDSFEVFLADMGKKPANSYFSRKDKKGNYTKENCEWKQETTITLNKVTKSIAQWSVLTGLTNTCIRSRIKAGKSPADILRVPAAVVMSAVVS